MQHSAPGTVPGTSKWEIPVKVNILVEEELGKKTTLGREFTIEKTSKGKYANVKTVGFDP